MDGAKVGSLNGLENRGNVTSVNSSMLSPSAIKLCGEKNESLPNSIYKITNW